MYRVTVTDEFGGSQSRSPVALDIEPTDTLRDMLRRRVQAEVRAFEKAKASSFVPLVQPSDVESILNSATPRRVDWEQQFRLAVEGFQKNGFFVIIDGKQVVELDAPLGVRPGSRVEFIRLVPLIGG